MPTLTLIFKGQTLAFDLAKIDRDRLYGYVETETVTADGEVCSRATLAGDGHTRALAGRGPQTEYERPYWGFCRAHGATPAGRADPGVLEFAAALVRGARLCDQKRRGHHDFKKFGNIRELCASIMRLGLRRGNRDRRPLAETLRKQCNPNGAASG
jgi:hypothetical protein